MKKKSKNVDSTPPKPKKSPTKRVLKPTRYRYRKWLHRHMSAEKFKECLYNRGRYFLGCFRMCTRQCKKTSS